MSKKQEPSKKDEVFWKVLNAAFELDTKKGHLKWSISDLSRCSGVTRSLIYYYFGKEKGRILIEGVKLIGEEMFGFTPARIELWKEGKIIESILLSRALNQKMPFIGTFYILNRNRQTEVGKLFRDYEVKYRDKLRSFFPEVTQRRLDVIWAVMFGFVLAPFDSEDAVSSIPNEKMISIFTTT